MRDYISIGATPSDEECAQVGTPDYPEKSKAECRAFKHQLERTFRDCPDGTYFTVKSFPHDFGSYREVVVSYDDDDEESREFAYHVENNAPSTWDDIAKMQLKEAECTST